MILPATNARLATALIGVTLAAAIAAPGASADPGATAYQDLRSPDARDAAERPTYADGPGAITYRDLRSPDARDAAEGYRPALEPQPPVDEPSSPDGFDWVSAAIGAAVGTGLLIALIVTVGGLARRRPVTRGHDTLRA
jgi:hypothetical protein